MNKWMMQNMLICGLLAALLAPVTARAVDTVDQAAIRKVILDTWDRPDARLGVDPIVVQGGYAVADWVQGKRGGRALLRRKEDGQWMVAVCAGDGLRKASMLEQTGMSAADAQSMAKRLARAEAAVTPRQRALFSSFQGVARMDGGGKHALAR